MSLINSFNREPWTAKAACAECDPDLHFPKGNTPGQRTGAHHRQATEAKFVCRECQVRQPCLEYALTNNEQYGIWGALDPGERAAMKRHQYKQTRKENQQK